MFLNCPSQTLEISFRVKHKAQHYMLYASTGSMKCFRCGGLGHKRDSCPREPAGGNPKPGDAPAEKRAAWAPRSGGEAPVGEALPTGRRRGRATVRPGSRVLIQLKEILTRRFQLFRIQQERENRWRIY